MKIEGASLGRQRGGGGLFLTGPKGRGTRGGARGRDDNALLLLLLLLLLTLLLLLLLHFERDNVLN